MSLTDSERVTIADGPAQKKTTQRGVISFVFHCLNVVFTGCAFGTLLVVFKQRDAKNAVSLRPSRVKHSRNAAEPRTWRGALKLISSFNSRNPLIMFALFARTVRNHANQCDYLKDDSS